jgi:hypothetical protein
MIDVDRTDGLDGNDAADALVAVRDRLREVEAERLLHAAHWADLHAVEELSAVEVALAPRSAAGRPLVLPGSERAVASGAAGTPAMEEFAAAELAALLGLSTGAGAQLIADAVNLRHRHPRAWARVREGAVPVWLVTKVARRCAAVGLTLERARWVDAQTTGYAVTLPPGRFLNLVEAKIVAADPAAAEERAREAALARFVRTGQTDEHGLRTLVARASAGDIVHLVAVIDRLAVILADAGDPDPLEARRATALRILANPARALAMLTTATLDHLDALDPATCREPDVLGEVDHQVPGGYDWRLDPNGHRTLPQLVDLRTPPAQAEDAHAADAVAGGQVGGGSVLDPALLRRVLDGLESFDPTRLDPTTVFHVHLSDTTLLAGVGVARVEELGPLVLAAVRTWLTDPICPEAVAHRVTIRPVLDTTTIAPVDRYELPPLMAEALKIRQPHEVFPYGTASSRRSLDADHARPYRPADRGGPPGQTTLDNLGRLSRRHHRIKTHGRWRLAHPDPDTWWWRTPHGHWLEVDPTGTTHHGRDPDLDTRLLDGSP